jgi:hypothetical protein
MHLHYACTSANLFTYLDKPVSLANLHTNGGIDGGPALFKGKVTELACMQVDLGRIGTHITIAWSGTIHLFRINDEIWQNSDASSQQEERRNTG